MLIQILQARRERIYPNNFGSSSVREVGQSFGHVIYSHIGGRSCEDPLPSHHRLQYELYNRSCLARSFSKKIRNKSKIKSVKTK